MESTTVSEDTALNSELDNEAILDPRCNACDESAVDSVESTTVSDDTALNTAVDTDATSDPRCNACEETTVDSVESTTVIDDTVLNNAVDNDATSDPRTDTRVESAVDSIESTAESDDATVDDDVDSEATPAVLSKLLDDNIAEYVPDATPDTATDNDCISDILAEALLTTDALTARMVEFIIVPVDIAEATFESVSRVDGAPPTNDITAVATAFDRLLPSALIISDIAVSLEVSDDSALDNVADIDATPELLA